LIDCEYISIAVGIWTYFGTTCSTHILYRCIYGNLFTYYQRVHRSLQYNRYVQITKQTDHVEYFNTVLDMCARQMY